ncbi:unnamed protein product, partial [Rotaria magnacalcarata]
IQAAYRGHRMRRRNNAKQQQEHTNDLFHRE